MEPTRAFLLRKTRYSDTSLIITWLSAPLGRIKTIAKGALRPKSPHAGALDLFHECELTFTRSKRSEVHTLTDVHAVRQFEGIRGNWLRTASAGYFVELAEKCCEPDHPADELYDLLGRALGYLDRSQPDLRAILHFEAELARCMGVAGNVSDNYLHLQEVMGGLPRGRTALLKQLTETSRRENGPTS